MEKLIPLNDWLAERFINPPSQRTARRWCGNGTIPAKKLGRDWFVEANKELAQSGQPDVDDLVNRVLKAG